MTTIEILSLSVSVLFLLLVIELVRRRKLVEDYSFVWIACAVALIVLSLWRDIIDIIAAKLGIYYPPVVLLLVVGAFVFLASLFFSVTISRQRVQIERLVEKLAVLEARVRDLDQKSTDDAPAADEPE